MTRCILFYKDARRDDTLEAVVDRECAAGRMELVGVSAPERGNIPAARRECAYIPPEELKSAAFDYVIVSELSGDARRDAARSGLKRRLPPFLLKAYRRLSALLLSRASLRRWRNYRGWGKPIERRPDMVFPEYSPLGEWGIGAEKTIPARTLSVPGFRTDEYAELRAKGITIVSDNCWGGLAYHTLGMEMQSPFINMFLNTEDFVKLIADLPHYMSLPLVPEKLCVRKRRAKAFPFVMLGDVRLCFNHVFTPEMLETYAEKWYRRRERMDLENVLVESCFGDRTEQEKFGAAFATCPYPTLLFSAFPDERYVYLSAFEENAARYKGDFAECTRDCAKNEYPGRLPFDFLRTFLTRQAKAPKE